MRLSSPFSGIAFWATTPTAWFTACHFSRPTGARRRWPPAYFAAPEFGVLWRLGLQWATLAWPLGCGLLRTARLRCSLASASRSGSQPKASATASSVRHLARVELELSGLEFPVFDGRSFLQHVGHLGLGQGNASRFSPARPIRGASCKACLERAIAPVEDVGVPPPRRS